MKNIVTAAIIAISASMITSCTKVIDVKLNDAAKKYVIDAAITDVPGTSSIKITQTRKFSDDNTYPGVSGAVVTITDKTTGVETTLAETSQGVYSTPTLIGTPGDSYAMKVVVGGETFTAESTMPIRVPLDTVYLTNDNIFGKTWKLANLEFDDPAGRGNAYRFKQYVNGVQIKQIFGTNDDLVDGRHVVSKLYIDPGVVDNYDLKSGDNVTIDFMCIDQAAYKYWFSLYMSATGNNQSAAPANPVTNITGGALGCFSAYTSQTKTVIVP